MAHYAKDCWDAEVETSYGWIEVAGHADRSCFDIERHAEKTKTELVAARTLKEPRKENKIYVTLEKKLLAPMFKKEMPKVQDAVSAWTED